MTTPKHPTRSRGGSRVYPIACPDGSTVECESVTSITGMMDKPALPRAAALGVAKRGAELKDRLPHLDDDAIVNMLKGAPFGQWKQAADAGTAVHSVVEDLLLGREVKEIDAELAHPVRGFLRLRREFDLRGVEVEATGANLEHGFAGTLDAIAEIDGQLWLLDVKTSKAVYPEHGVQMSAYRNFEFLVTPDGTRRPMPQVAGALVMHLPRDPSVEPALVRVASGAPEFEAFLGLLAALRWRSGHSRAVVGDPMRTRDQLVPF